MKPTLSSSRKALDLGNYCINCFGSRIKAYDTCNADKRKKRLRFEMDSHMFNPTDPSSSSSSY